MPSIRKPAASGQSSSSSSSSSLPSLPRPSPERETPSVTATAARDVRRFGVEVRLRRIALGLRLVDLAPRAHLSPDHLGHIESGRRGTNPSLGVALSIARALGTDLQDLLGGFKGLTPRGIEAGRICDALPESVQAVMIALLRAASRSVNGAAADDR
jgi:transcriptional regulator with XRE-family HTH domain